MLTSLKFTCELPHRHESVGKSGGSDFLGMTVAREGHPALSFVAHEYVHMFREGEHPGKQGTYYPIFRNWPSTHRSQPSMAAVCPVALQVPGHLMN